jgi:hypothetical protein
LIPVRWQDAGNTAIVKTTRSANLDRLNTTSRSNMKNIPRRRSVCTGVSLFAALLLVTQLLGSQILGIQILATQAWAQPFPNRKYNQEDKFRQLEEILPTPNDVRSGSGAPGRGYWQQQADYKIEVELDDKNQRIIGSETIKYTNNSPDTLRYLWLQIDNNIFHPQSDSSLIATSPSFADKVSYRSLRRTLANATFDGSVKITSVTDPLNKPMKYSVVKTMMRLELTKPLKTAEVVEFSIGWNYEINDSKKVGARTGFEFFEKDGNYLYEIAHWFPRMVSYTDVHGWQHKQFLGRGEFTLEIGDYEVSITVPSDHIVGSTGVLQNPKQVLTKEQQKRFEEARTAKKPVFIVTPAEAKENEKSKPAGKKTWVYKAERVRDFAFASSRKFIWDAQGHIVAGNHVMAMSYYPKEGEPLWSKYSTHSIIHTLNVYSRYTFAYPYPVAISVNGPVYGMEYPMICFNGPRPEEDGTYSKRTKYALISVIIHEVGHNYFPMIVNSDERQWTWMDEGINTFLQYLSEKEWEDDYPSWRGEPKQIVEYMKSSGQVPIMTNSESILQFGNNAYGKPATALNVLRETVLGREQFDYAFKEYARRWKFKRPMPADFFRTMEDASGVDLDWFWRGWFYTTEHCDISIENVKLFTSKSGDPKIDKGEDRKKRDDEPETLSETRNQPLIKRVNRYPELKDFYNTYDQLDVTESDIKSYQEMLKKLDEEEKALLNNKKFFYVIDLKNVGGLVMPVILQLNFPDKKTEEIRIPAEIWRRNHETVSKLVITDRELESISLDPHRETADVEIENNFFPRRIIRSRFQIFKDPKPSKNEMKNDQDRRKREADALKKAAAAKKKQTEEKKKKEAMKKADAENKPADAKEPDKEKPDKEEPDKEKPESEIKSETAEPVTADK